MTNGQKSAEAHARKGSRPSTVYKTSQAFWVPGITLNHTARNLRTQNRSTESVSDLFRNFRLQAISGSGNDLRGLVGLGYGIRVGVAGIEVRRSKKLRTQALGGQRSRLTLKPQHKPHRPESSTTFAVPFS